ncbi:MAG: hypothetical protein IH806_11255 [Proteobacteria bacterium]|nr:hypothetical protein [Pseudomonadota bacterium]
MINTAAAERPEFVRQVSEAFGSSTIVVCIDVKKSRMGKYRVMKSGGRKRTGREPVEFARQMADMGAGEIMINSIDRDGTMEGYDIDLTRMVADAVAQILKHLIGGILVRHLVLREIFHG